MPRTVRTARGETIDFDMLIVKQQIAEAPMNVEVQRRKEFIDNKEGKTRGRQASGEAKVTAPIEVSQTSAEPSSDFEVEGEVTPTKKRK